MSAPRFVGGDTMNFWIEGTPNELAETIREWDFLLINDSEARQLSGEHNLRKAARKIIEMGPQTLVIKRGEYGAILFRPDGYFVAPGFLLEDVFDPTGAGDSFAGGFMGYLAEQGVAELDQASRQHLHRAMIYGSVMGSFCCEQFGVGRLRTLSRKDIERRYQEFKAFMDF
jgi:sugar/nucleoside kinase (ribokinase family)